ncbi:hypothetical protein ACH5RR_018976 [Cinchona calisaya]|uniref:Protein kinase domain-containing protein n=1 Tax=Cinchona calisaya TaxID=153742 RepID=A0ABD2ZN10_9GENT
MKACRGFIQHLNMSVTIYNIDVEKHGKAVTEICRKIKRLSQLRHPNLQSLIGYCHNEPENQMFIVYDHIGFDTLHSHLYGNRNATTPMITKAFGLPTAKPEESDASSLGLVLLEVLCSRRTDLFDCGGTIIRSLKRSIERKIFHLMIDSTLKGEIAATCLSEFLNILFSCLLVKENERPSLGDVVKKLKFSLELQEKAEEKKQDINGKGSDIGFRLEDIYEEIHYLASADLEAMYGWKYL